VKLVKKSELEIVPVNWLGLHREYLQSGEMEVIAALVRSVRAESMIEIGCRDGRTAKVLLHNVLSLNRYVGVDVPYDYEPGLAHQKREMVASPGYLATSDPRFELIIRESGSLDLMPSDLFPVDAVFIDGDHSEQVVSHDSQMAYAIAQKLIIWHDAFNSAVEVMRVLNRLCDDGWPIQMVEGTWLAFLRR
jgi:predicted O-methyltransferase YrrM